MHVCMYLETYATFTLLNLHKIRCRQYVIAPITELLKQSVYAYFSLALFIMRNILR